MRLALSAISLMEAHIAVVKLDILLLLLLLLLLLIMAVALRKAKSTINYSARNQN